MTKTKDRTLGLSAHTPYSRLHPHARDKRNPAPWSRPSESVEDIDDDNNGNVGEESVGSVREPGIDDPPLSSGDEDENANPSADPDVDDPDKTDELIDLMSTPPSKRASIVRAQAAAGARYLGTRLNGGDGGMRRRVSGADEDDVLGEESGPNMSLFKKLRTGPNYDGSKRQKQKTYSSLTPGKAITGRNSSGAKPAREFRVPDTSSSMDILNKLPKNKGVEFRDPVQPPKGRKLGTTAPRATFKAPLKGRLPSQVESKKQRTDRIPIEPAGPQFKMPGMSTNGAPGHRDPGTEKAQAQEAGRRSKRKAADPDRVETTLPALKETSVRVAGAGIAASMGVSDKFERKTAEFRLPTSAQRATIAKLSSPSRTRPPSSSADNNKASYSYRSGSASSSLSSAPSSMPPSPTFSSSKVASVNNSNVPGSSASSISDPLAATVNITGESIWTTEKPECPLCGENISRRVLEGVWSSQSAVLSRRRGRPRAGTGPGSSGGRGLPKLTISVQRQIHRDHLCASARKTWHDRFYPDIKWDTLEARFEKHEPRLAAVLRDDCGTAGDSSSSSSWALEHSASWSYRSFYRRRLERLAAAGGPGSAKHGSVMAAMARGDDGGETLGYYGSRGARLMTDWLMPKFRSRLSSSSGSDTGSASTSHGGGGGGGDRKGRSSGPGKRYGATTDRLIAVSGGIAQFVQAVLVPELACALVVDDLCKSKQMKKGVESRFGERAAAMAERRQDGQGGDGGGSGGGISWNGTGNGVEDEWGGPNEDTNAELERLARFTLEESADIGRYLCEEEDEEVARNADDGGEDENDYENHMVE